MKKVVAKFGGSNLREEEDIRRIIKAVSLYSQPLVAVVSAFYGVTDMINQALHEAPESEDPIHRLIDQLTEIKTKALEKNLRDPFLRASTLEELNKRLEQLRRLLLGVHYIADVPAGVHDRILSYGERLSSLMLRAFFQEAGLECRELMPEQMGLVTDGAHHNATVDFAAAAPLVSASLETDSLVVVPGFYGISPAGQVTLLGRGGSDYSAAAIARCVGAESLDIWKDVDGFMSADPRTVSNPLPLSQLSYREAAELSYFGARILHPRTVEPLQDSGIPIRLFNIRRVSEGLSPLSVIESDHKPMAGPGGVEPSHRVKSVTATTDFGILRLSGSGVGIRPGVLGKATATLADKGINIKSVVTTQTSINVFLAGGDLERARHLVSRMDLPTVARIEALKDYAMVALVGEGLEECEEIAQTLILALSRGGVHAKMISIGASESATYFIVQRKQVDESLRLVHEAFFGGEMQNA